MNGRIAAISPSAIHRTQETFNFLSTTLKHQIKRVDTCVAVRARLWFWWRRGAHNGLRGASRTGGRYCRCNARRWNRAWLTSGRGMARGLRWALNANVGSCSRVPGWERGG